MDAGKEKCPKTGNEAEKRSGVKMFSAASRRPLRTMLSLPEGMLAGNGKTELAVETKTLKYGQEELAKGLATLFTMEEDMKKKQIKLACDETKLQKRVEEQNQNQELLTKQNMEKELQNMEKEQNKEKEIQEKEKLQNKEKELQKENDSAKREQKIYKE